MKRMIMLLCVLCVGMSYAQKERELILNEKANLIEVTYFHDNGTISQTGFYTVDGKVHGDWYSYCQEGNKLTSAQYDNGHKVGKWFFWMGDVLKEVDYQKGKIVAIHNWTGKETVIASND